MYLDWADRLPFQKSVAIIFVFFFLFHLSPFVSLELLCISTDEAARYSQWGYDMHRLAFGEGSYRYHWYSTKV